MIDNQEKQRVWDAYRARKPIRVPATLGANSRVILLDEAFNLDGISFEQYYHDPAAAVDIQLKLMDYRADYLSRFCDYPSGRPEELAFYVDIQTLADSAYFGCPINFRDGQIPDTTPILEGSHKNDLFDFPLDRPLDNPFIQECLRRHEDLCRQAASVNVKGLKVSVAPVTMAWDGPLTVATELRGTEIFSDLVEDPEYAVRLMTFIMKAVEIRNRALAEQAGLDVFKGTEGGLSDDSIQLIGLDMFKELILPLHRQWLGKWAGGPHGMHLCGDATRHMPTLHEELNVCSFETGFPVDHGALRKALGPDVEIIGGPEVGLLTSGTAGQVYQRTKDILLSGVKEGGRFLLREGNNLPPKVSEANLAAMYQACLDYGQY